MAMTREDYDAVQSILDYHYNEVGNQNKCCLHTVEMIARSFCRVAKAQNPNFKTVMFMKFITDTK